MRVVIATDSFKGSATSLEVAKYIEQGIKQVTSTAIISKLPIADGGEGTVEALVNSLKGRYIKKKVTGPLAKSVEARFGIINENIAVIEMSEASGITLLNDNEKNPYKTTTYGTGELIKAALDYGVKEIMIGIGGSATNDGGVGMAQALGVSFKNKNNTEVGFGAEGLRSIENIDISGIDKRINNTIITVLSDVTNPLVGYNGASYIYGGQKGATPNEIKELDCILNDYGNKIEEQLNIKVVNQPGAGAAGGLGAGLVAFCNAKIQSGADEILELIDIERYIRRADLVITGEGRMDSQSVHGKAPIAVAKVAQEFKKPVIAVVGSEGENVVELYNHGIDLIIDIINEPMTLNYAQRNVRKLLGIAGQKAIRAFLLNNKLFNKVKEELN